MFQKEIVLGNQNNFNIAVLGDMHIGDPLCDIDLIKRTINYIKGLKNTIVILNGDLINNAIKTSVSDVYGEILSIEQQQDKLIELLLPIKDKITIIASGNHEHRTLIQDGIDPLRYVAQALGIMNAYCPEAYLLTIKYGLSYGKKDKSNAYTVFGIHGSHSGGKLAGSTVNAMENMNKVICNADLYLHSHTHATANFTDKIGVMVNGKLTLKTRIYYNTPAFLEYGGYAEDAGFKMCDNSQSIIQVSSIRNQKDNKNEMITYTDIIKIPV